MNSTFQAKLSQHLLSQSKGFTLIELLVVIVIVGVLSAVAVPTFLNQVARSRSAEAESALATTASALTVYAFDCGDYDPTGGVAGLVSATACNGAAAGDEGPWLEQEFSVLAPNYSVAVIGGANLTGATLTTGGVAGAYVGISCTKGVGDQAGATDGCDR